MKYIFKESELNAVLKNIIAEEILRSTRINEGFGRFLKNVGKLALGATLAPGNLAGDAINKYGNLISPTGNETLKSTFNDVKDFLGFENGVKNKDNKLTDLKTEKRKKEEQGFETAYSKSDIRKKYGEPETLGGMGSNLDKKKDIVIDNFLGSGKSEVFKKHYYEKSQGRIDSIFNKKLEELKKNSGYNTERGKKLFEAWLVERDAAYEKYIRG